MAAAGVFALLQAYAFLQYLRDKLTKQEFQVLFFLGISLAAAIVFLSVIYLTYSGYIAPWSGRFYSLWDTGYAKIHIPIIASVSEHQPTTWVSFFFDLHILVCTFPAGLWFCIRNINDERVFVALYAISAVYFAGVMVRLMLTLTPVVCMLSAIAFSSVFEHYLGDDMKRENLPIENSSDEDDKRNPGNLYDKAGKVRKHISEQEKTEDGLGPNIKSIVTMLMLMLLMMFAVHCTWVTSNAYSSPSVVLASYNHDGGGNIGDDPPPPFQATVPHSTSQQPAAARHEPRCPALLPVVAEARVRRSASQLGVKNRQVTAQHKPRRSALLPAAMETRAGSSTSQLGVGNRRATPETIRATPGTPEPARSEALHSPPSRRPDAPSVSWMSGAGRAA
ncbi:dolichyl-diphosphooligosaccharide-protein glycosyltransferase subunit STT3B-like [Crotalus adamanteus]|uniref:dolichyl-diphosphooligosaccharide--protein glycotransferase n=1 Tax=Crotalus adamanteus TaxID=8729 RepID=A0AAW1B051_CROAD